MSRCVWPFVFGHIESDEISYISSRSNVIMLEVGWKVKSKSHPQRIFFSFVDLNHSTNRIIRLWVLLWVPVSLGKITFDKFFSQLLVSELQKNETRDHESESVVNWRWQFITVWPPGDDVNIFCQVAINAWFCLWPALVVPSLRYGGILSCQGFTPRRLETHKTSHPFSLTPIRMYTRSDTHPLSL
jgi:hypothetical protein